MCYSRRKNTQFCNINIAIRGIFVAQSAIIIIFNTNLNFWSVIKKVIAQRELNLIIINR